MLIALFALVNLILGAMLAWRANEARVLDAETRAGVIEVLARGGISVADNVIPGETAPVYVLEAVRDTAAEKKAFDALLGRTAAEDQGGNMYFYSGPDGWARARGSGNLEIGITAGSAAADNSPDAVMDTLGFEYDAARFRWDKQSFGESCTITQYISGRAVFNCEMTFYYNSLGLFEMSGRWVIASPVAVGDSSARAPLTALLDLLAAWSDGQSAYITAMELGYFTGLPAPGYIRLTPVWKISSDKGDFFINAMTGAMEGG